MPPAPTNCLQTKHENPMLSFILRRLVLLIPVVLGILVVTFALTRLIPGDACTAMLGEHATPALCASFRERFGLNDSLPVQFARYVATVTQGDFGTSIRNGRPVTEILAERLPMTMELAIAAMLFAVTFGIILGVVSAINHNSSLDVGTVIGANIGVSIPVFVLGLVLAYIFAVVLKNTPFFIPPSGRLTPGVSMTPLTQEWGLANAPGIVVFFVTLLSNSVILHSLLIGKLEITQDALWHLLLPAIAVGTIPLAIIARLTRSSLLDVLGQDYVRTARAKGLQNRTVLWKHAFRSALIPIVTIIGLQVGSLLSGAVLTETVFALPGVGTQIVSAISARDYPVLQGFVVTIALIFAMVTIVVDLSYASLDPRIRVQ